ncbi:hypothetical protein TNCV_2222411 [Trichonephila clavipes]|nr:hypothetical protein TNCV_2222411 [Trichonephila clavipes]
MGGPPFHKDYNSNLYTDPVVYKPENFWECLSPHRKKGDAFPTPGRRQCTHKYIMVWDVFWEFPAFWVSYGPREDIPPLTSDQSEKADCVSRKESSPEYIGKPPRNISACTTNLDTL